MITLDNGTDTVELPDLYWSDELEWTETEARDERSVTGKLLRQTSAKVAGRPITLQPPDDYYGRVLLGTLRTLRGWTDGGGALMTLTLADASTYSVRWRYPNPIEAAKPTLGHTSRDDGELWLATLNLITVET